MLGGKRFAFPPYLDFACPVETKPAEQPSVASVARMEAKGRNPGGGSSRQYFLRDTARSWAESPVYQVSAEGQIRRLGVMTPVRPEGFVMLQEDGVALHSEGLPWWLQDMRPTGFLGCAIALRFAAELGLPTDINEWSDAHVLRALTHHGEDGVGNFLLGDSSAPGSIKPPEPTRPT